MTPYHSDPLVTLYAGDCLEVMAGLPDASVDSVVTDPPYGLEFMNKTWDRLGDTSGTLSRQKLPLPHFRAENVGAPAQIFHHRWATEAFRVLKPGGYLLAFGGTRTYHRLASAIEDAGFEIRDSLMHIYASGFPKSLNVSKDSRFCHCGREALPEHDLSGVRDTDLSEAVSAQGGEAVLLPPMQEQRPRVRRRNRPDATEAEASLWPSEPGVEGRGDVLQDEGQLQRSPVHPSAGVGEADGPQGRVHDGAPAGHGDVDGPSAGPDGSGEPQGSQPVEQRPVQPRTVAVQRDAQSGGVWPLCDGCGKPQVPTGLGSALKPAHEPIVMARKPLIGTIAGNVVRYGTGALNIEASRIGYTSEADKPTQEEWNRAGSSGKAGANGFAGQFSKGMKDAYAEGKIPVPSGRWPSNVLLSDPELFDEPNPWVVGSGATTTSGDLRNYERANREGWAGPMPAETGFERDGDSGGYSRFFKIPHRHEWVNFENSPATDWCSCGALREDAAAVTSEPTPPQPSPTSDEPPRDELRDYPIGFCIPKADRAERERGLREFEQKQVGGRNRADGRQWDIPGSTLDNNKPPRSNHHPTVKPIDLMRHLVRLVTPPGGTVLDCFAGSGTTLLAASEEGIKSIGIEREEEYARIAVGRLMATPMGLGLDHGLAGKAPPKTHPDLSKHQPKRRAASENYTGGWVGTTTVKIEDAGWTASKDDPCTCDHERPDGRHAPSPGCRMCEWCVDEEPAA